jgi:hypothetical protein
MHRSATCIIFVAAFFFALAQSAHATAADDKGKVKEGAAKDSNAGNKGNSGRAKSSSDSSKDEKLPAALENLNLSSQQRDQVQGIVREYDSDLDSAWQEFSDRYLEAVGMEASMLAAIEENFNDTQRKHIHKQRHKRAMSGKSASKDDKNEKGTIKTDAGNVKKATGTAKSNEEKGDDDDDDDVVVEEVVIVGVSLTPDQQAAADNVHSKYFDRLRTLDRDIEHLHSRLVALETEKLVKIEKVLTKDQLAQLRKHHQTSQAEKVSSGKGGATKTE